MSNTASIITLALPKSDNNNITCIHCYIADPDIWEIYIYIGF